MRPNGRKKSVGPKMALFRRFPRGKKVSEKKKMISRPRRQTGKSQAALKACTSYFTTLSCPLSRRYPGMLRTEVVIASESNGLMRRATFSAPSFSSHPCLHRRRAVVQPDLSQLIGHLPERKWPILLVDRPQRRGLCWGKTWRPPTAGFVWEVELPNFVDLSFAVLP